MLIPIVDAVPTVEQRRSLVCGLAPGLALARLGSAEVGLFEDLDSEPKWLFRAEDSILGVSAAGPDEWLVFEPFRVTRWVLRDALCECIDIVNVKLFELICVSGDFFVDRRRPSRLFKLARNSSFPTPLDVVHRSRIRVLVRILPSLMISVDENGCFATWDSATGEPKAIGRTGVDLDRDSVGSVSIIDDVVYVIVMSHRAPTLFFSYDADASSLKFVRATKCVLGVVNNYVIDFDSYQLVDPERLEKVDPAAGVAAGAGENEKNRRPSTRVAVREDSSVCVYFCEDGISCLYGENGALIEKRSDDRRRRRPSGSCLPTVQLDSRLNFPSCFVRALSGGGISVVLANRRFDPSARQATALESLNVVEIAPMDVVAFEDDSSEVRWLSIGDESGGVSLVRVKIYPTAVSVEQLHRIKVFSDGITFLKVFSDDGSSTSKKTYVVCGSHKRFCVLVKKTSAELKCVVRGRCRREVTEASLMIDAGYAFLNSSRVYSLRTGRLERVVAADFFPRKKREIRAGGMHADIDRIRDLEHLSYDAYTSAIMDWDWLSQEQVKALESDLDLRPPAEKIDFGWLRNHRQDWPFMCLINSAGKCWSVSPTMTAAHKLALVSLFMSRMESAATSNDKLNALYADLVYVYGVVNERPMSVEYLSRACVSESADAAAARLLLSNYLTSSTDQVRTKQYAEWKATLLSWEASGRMGSDGKLAVYVLSRLGVIDPSLLEVSVAKKVASILIGAVADPDSSNSFDPSFAAELLSFGFALWRPYVDDVRLLMLQLLKTHHDASSGDKKSALRALGELGSVHPETFVSVVGGECALNTETSTESFRSRAMLVLTRVVSKEPMVFFRYLPSVVEIVVRSLDPSEPKLRKSSLKSSTKALHDLVKKFNSLCFHQQTQRFCCGTSEGPVVVYDLRTATKWRVLEGHESAVFATAFSPDGSKVASHSNGIVKIWSLGHRGMFGGYLSVKGKCLKTIRVQGGGATEEFSLANCRISWTSPEHIELTTASKAVENIEA